MKCRFKKMYLVCLLISLMSCSSIEKEHLTAEKVITNYFLAIGGYQNLQDINSLVKKGHYIEPGYNLVLDAQQLRMRPHYRKVGNLETVGFEEGFDGTAWEFTSGKGLRRSEGKAKEAIVVSSDFDFPFVDAEKKGYQMEFTGIKKIGGLLLNEIMITMPFENSRYVTHFYFDTQSHLMIAQSKSMPIHAKGEDIDIIVLYSDYKPIEGVLYPFTQIERNERTGQFLNATIWSKISANKKLSIQDFNPPKS